MIRSLWTWRNRGGKCLYRKWKMGIFFSELVEWIFSLKACSQEYLRESFVSSSTWPANLQRWPIPSRLDSAGILGDAKKKQLLGWRRKHTQVQIVVHLITAKRRSWSQTLDWLGLGMESDMVKIGPIRGRLCHPRKKRKSPPGAERTFVAPLSGVTRA